MLVRRYGCECSSLESDAAVGASAAAPGEAEILVAATVHDEHDKRLEDVRPRDGVDGAMVLKVPERVARMLEGRGRVEL